jgi:tRNA pseudouridine55 synthase
MTSLPGTRRIGHTGTLDPLATGVLALVVGQATRLSQFLTGAIKAYDATVRLGVATDTYDAQGEPCGTATPSAVTDAISDETVAAALSAFHGEFEQMPPPFSAKKVGGVRAYTFARRRVTVAAKPVPVRVHRLELVERNHARLLLRVEASSGFYVRSLAHDIGTRLGCGAHLEALRRTRSGMFTLERSVRLDVLCEDREAALSRLIAMEELLPDLPAFDLSEAGTRKARHGNALGPSDGRMHDSAIPQEHGLSRLLSSEGRLVGLARTSPAGTLQPVVVLS